MARRIVPIARLGAVLVVGVLGLLLYAGLPDGGTPEPVAVESADAPASGPSSPAPREDPPVAEADGPAEVMGLPTDPLPEPLAVSSDDPDAAAGTLAQAVMAGGSDALAALTAAVARAGFAIYGPDGTVAVPAEGRDEGLHVESWQVRSMLGAVGARKHASVPIVGLAAGLAAAIPSLNGEPVAQLLVDGIVESAHGDDPRLRFWARFINELGKRHAHGAYNLLAHADLARVRLDVAQLVLLTRRLSADLHRAAGGEVAAEARGGPFSLPVLYAGEPCAPDGPRPEPRATGSAFRQLIRTLTAPGRAIGRAVSPSLANYLDYGSLTLMLSALKVEVEMEGGGALKRTKTRTAGERRKIRTTVSLDGTPLEWVNCYRAWLNSHGREMRVHPRANGPLADVPVDFWFDGQGLVQLPESSSVTMLRGWSDVVKTDDRGVARLDIEGTPQDRDLANATKELRKSASLTASATVKMSDLLTRSHPTEGLASADGIHAWVTEQELTIEVPYRFEVIDWSDTPGRWTGTLTVVETTITGTSGRAPFGTGGNSWQETETSQLTVRVTDTAGEQAASGLHASLKGRAEASYDRLKTSASWVVNSCGTIKNRRMNNTGRDSSRGTGSSDATISVSVFEDGTYLIAASMPELVMPITGQVEGELEVFRTRGEDCVLDVKADARPHAPSERSAGAMIQTTGRVDPQNPNVFAGSTTEDGATGIGKRVKTTTWQFRRH